MNYFRQALAMMREEKLFSGIYIAGTAMALAFTMVMAVVYYIKLAPIYPELNRGQGGGPGKGFPGASGSDGN